MIANLLGPYVTKAIECGHSQLNSTVKNIAKLLGGTTGAQVISIAAAPIITHIYEPETYGILGLYVAITTLFVMISTGRYHMAIVIPETEQEADHLLYLSLLFAIFVASISLPIMMILGDEIAAFTNSPALSALLLLAPLTIVVRGGYLSLQYYSVRKKRFGSIAFSQVGDSSVGATANIVGGLLIIPSALTLVAGRLLGGCFSLAVIILSLRHELRSGLSSLTPAGLKNAAIMHKKFPLVSSWAIFLNTAAYTLPVLLLAFFFSAEVVGLFTLADRVIITPLGIVGGAVAQVFYQKISEDRQKAQNISSSIALTLDKLSSICIFPLLVLGCLGQDIFAIVFGDSWREAGLYAQILSFYAISRFIVAPLTNTASTIGKQEIELYFNIVLALLRCVAIFVGGWQGDILLTLALLSLGSVTSYLFLLYLICKNTHYSFAAAALTIGKHTLRALPFIALIVVSLLTYGFFTAAVVTTLCLFFHAGYLYKENKHFFG